MTSIEGVFSLVRSMTKSEKRYFRMMAEMQKGEKSYVTLFDQLDKHDVLDDTLIADIRQHFPGYTVEPARKHLYRVLMKSLRQFDSEKDIETRLSNLLQDSRLLHKKGLLKSSFEQLEKAKALALQREKFIYFILAARQELQYLVRTQFAGIDEYQLIEKQKKLSTLLEQQNRIQQHSILYEILLLRYWKNGVVRSQQEVTRLNDLLLEEYQLLNSPGDKPFELQQLHLHFQSIYFQMTGNPQGSLSVFYELDELFQKNESLWKDAPIYYFYLLDGVLYDLRLMERYENMTYFLDRLKVMRAEGEELALVVKYRILEHELNRFVDQKLYDQAKKLLKVYEPSWKRESSLLPFHMHAQVLFSVVRVFVGGKDYSSALRLINTALNQPAGSMNPPQQIAFQLLNLMVNALLKNTDYLYYALRSLERKLKSERKLFGVEHLIMTFLKKQMAVRSMPDFEQQLHALSGNPFEYQLIKELSVQEWYSRMVHKI
ncbi:MAG TPA: hypothetical protein VD816_03590 [Ohtaekwangia sp.]|nr:hypothetical protein [Ohtaekwangia sp.]